MTFTAAETAAMSRALTLAATGPRSANPQVGCILLDSTGRTIAQGHHEGAGTPHAEAQALAKAGAAARGATAVVTLEPCDHTGRTGPCSQALIDAGVARVVFAQADPNPAAAGGPRRLRDAGIDVESGLLGAQAAELNADWTVATGLGRPYVLWKFATTLDGRSAAADGTSRWVSSVAARRDTHRLRASCDAILVGTNTVAVDDPLLTVRGHDDLPLAVQPMRVVMGLRDLSGGRRVFNADAQTVRLLTRDPHAALSDLRARGIHRVFLEGGPTLAAAFLNADLVDEIVVYVAPMLLGAGRSAVGDLGIETLADALHLDVVDVTVLEPAHADDSTNVRLTLQRKVA